MPLPTAPNRDSTVAPVAATRLLDNQKILAYVLLAPSIAVLCFDLQGLKRLSEGVLGGSALGVVVQESTGGLLPIHQRFGGFVGGFEGLGDEAAGLDG